MLERSRTVEELVSRLKGLVPGHFQYLEVKQLAEILSRHRNKAREALKDYSVLKRAIAAETDAIEKLYLGYEGMFLRDHLRDALRLYVMINRDFHEAYRSYMDALDADNAVPMAMVFGFAPVKVPAAANGVTKMSQLRRKRA